jgi:nucleoid-associated protein YgaU
LFHGFILDKWKMPGYAFYKGRALALSDSTIGIKVADGSYFPILEKGFTGRKKLTVTTVKDNQKKVQIDLYRGNGSSLTQASYIGSLVIENIPPATQGAPEIELLLSLDEEGQLSAEASDMKTGESQKFATTLATPSDADAYAEPEFVMDEPGKDELGLEETPLTGEAYPVGEKDRREEALHRRTPNILLLVLFVVLGVALVAAIAYFAYRAIQGPVIPPLNSSTVTAPAPTAATQATAAQPSSTPATAIKATTAQPSSTQTTTQSAMTAQPSSSTSPKQVSYLIKKGDTLWDISATYYRNPWLYPKLAAANSIKNPDLIFAGTRINIPEN